MTSEDKTLKIIINAIDKTITWAQDVEKNGKGYLVSEKRLVEKMLGNIPGTVHSKAKQKQVFPQQENYHSSSCYTCNSAGVEQLIDSHSHWNTFNRKLNPKYDLYFKHYAESTLTHCFIEVKLQHDITFPWNYCISNKARHYRSKYLAEHMISTPGGAQKRIFKHPIISNNGNFNIEPPPDSQLYTDAGEGAIWADAIRLMLLHTDNYSLGKSIYTNQKTRTFQLFFIDKEIYRSFNKVIHSIYYDFNKLNYVICQGNDSLGVWKKRKNIENGLDVCMPYTYSSAELCAYLKEVRTI
jgi:hypothetical protein